MLTFTDMTAALDETKSARMDQRTKPHVKAAIKQAAALLAVDESTFVTNAAYERALQTLRDHEKTALKPEDRDVFFAALGNPKAPTDEMKEAFAIHRDMVVDDE